MPLMSKKHLPLFLIKLNLKFKLDRIPNKVLEEMLPQGNLNQQLLLKKLDAAD
jgi:hypothetical protein